jgi:hypothetical protein
LDSLDEAKDDYQPLANLPELLCAMNLQRLTDKLAAAGFKARAEGDWNNF